MARLKHKFPSGVCCRIRDLDGDFYACDGDIDPCHI